MPTPRDALTGYIDDLRDWCTVTSGDPDLGHDVAQDTAVTALRGLDRLRDPRSLRTWLFRIARRRLADLMRRRSAAVPLTTDPPAPPLPDPCEPAPEEQVRDAMSCLPRPLRRAVVLHYLHGRSLREVADRLALTRSAVKMRLHRARCLMRAGAKP